MKIGFVGIGAMGDPMSRRLLAAGHALVVHDALSQRAAALGKEGAEVADSPRAVADRADIVFACLPTLDAYREAVLGANGIVHGKKRRLFVNLGTTGSVFSTDMEARLKEFGLSMVDSPISGGPPGARAGSLSVMISGDETAFRELEPIVSAFGSTVTFAGPRVGLAQSLKLVNNVMSACALAITSEAFVMGAKAGLDPEVMVKAVNAGSGRNSATLQKFPDHVLNRAFDFGATLNIIKKDVDLCLAEADALKVPMWVGTAVRQLLLHAIAEGSGEDDLTNLVRRLEGWADVEMPKTR